ncbi:MAG: alpha/beta hydrolase [Thermodesulfobacteriota bacterium]|nr:alpha/beta hydrolase [Thermodesulfobacteriota bacterium]
MVLKDIFVTLCMLTRRTDKAAGFLGVRFFLPALFRRRYANMGRLDTDTFTRQLDNIKTFKDTDWCGYWNAIAAEYEQKAAETAASQGNQNSEAIRDLLIRAVTYYTVSAFPGDSPLKMQAYHKAGALLAQIAPMYEENLEPLTLDIKGEKVNGYVRYPQGNQKGPMVIITNGLEGTLQEILIPLQKYRDSGLGVFVMEMPGTYACTTPMSAQSEKIYNGVIEHFASHPTVDAGKIGMIGISFGGYWSARMAAVNPDLNCAVVCGAPLHHAFTFRNSIGMPEIFVSALKKVLGAKSLRSLRKATKALSFKKNDLYRQIKIPLLIINGENDTLTGTRDSIELNMKVPSSLLKLYKGDDHCAMENYDHWLDLTFDWLNMQFSRTPDHESHPQ